MSSVRQFLVAGLLCTALVATGMTAPPTATHAAVQATRAPADHPYDDEFNTTTLNTKKWKWINPNPSPPSLTAVPAFPPSLTAVPGYLQLKTTPGADLSDKRQNAPLLLETAPAGNFEITVSLVFTPTANYQQAGIVMFANANNWGKAVFVHHTATEFASGAHVQGKYTFMVHSAPSGMKVSHVYLQLDKRGVTYTGYESTDGTHWQMIWPKGVTLPSNKVAPTMIGMLAMTGNNGSSHVIPADFDFFQERPLTATAPGPLPVAK